MSDLLERLKIENQELVEKITKLQSFINDREGPYSKLDNVNKYLLRKQLHNMKNYSTILMLRINKEEKAKDGLTIYVWSCQKEIPKPKYRPFTWEERDKLRGKWIINKAERNTERAITNFCLDRNGIFKIAYKDSSCYITANRLLDQYEFADGSPCGVLESTN